MAADTLAPLVTTVTPELDDPTMPIRRRVRRARWAPLAAALVLSACGPRPAPAPPPPKVKVVQAVAREITEWDEYTARLDAIDSVEVRPWVSGCLQSIRFQDGAVVHAGARLLRLDPRPAACALRP